MVNDDARRVLVEVAQLAADHIERRRDDLVAAPYDRVALRVEVEAFDFASPRDPAEVAATLFDLLRRTGIRTDHPRYFGLFNPPALTSAIAGDMVAATVNPQLAVWGHAPAAVEIERHLVSLFANRVWGDGAGAGTFTSGGSEANNTALLAALARRYPEWATRGVAALDRRPAIYVSAQAHLAWIKIARAAGLGSGAVKLVETQDGLSLDGQTLEKAILGNPASDPVLVVATAGTTAHGAVDDLSGIADVGRKHRAHVHVDAAWAGGVLLDPAHRHLLDGIDQADSVTIDPHKWLAVPMGAGLYLARDWTALKTAFAVTTKFMPPAVADTLDPYTHSLQWSRRFTGAKLFLALAALGLDGYAKMIEQQFALGDRLRQSLANDGWRIVNDTRLPLVCFAPDDAAHVVTIEREIAGAGEAWISSVTLRGAPCLRACITGFETTEDDVDTLVAMLARARNRCAG
ncbi:pyridoxal phosphate-dependent decarboxylase family protein [Sphingomonas aurantiaca]|uniref:pyridoxal phosphate-dependent decarboxylase family protein n=1 Tax=Sphingomonas aurantiaca TaxID=185949 RepID=UPI003356454C